ncbi:hypothetical protein [Luteirhabdus pelagi]|uniref:hypothetical protein n=1 Tax=Luteirhabdus pelagi TaxID=2792783 RepID=UPI0019397FBA|nr:hypothetical protein [Luteirhabdus pelagi]
MLLNVSYNNKKITQRIDAEVGKPFTMLERIKLGGIGSPRLVITEMSLQLHNLMVLDNNRNVCNIEMRPNGIIVGFRSLLESYALVIPYYKLVLYKGKKDQYSIYRDNYFVKVQAKDKDTSIHKFMAKVVSEKAENAPTRPENR